MTPSPWQYQQDQSGSRVSPPGKIAFSSKAQRFKTTPCTSERSPGWDREKLTRGRNVTVLNWADRCYFVTQPWDVCPRQSDKQESELAHVLWETRLVQTASNRQEVTQGEGERSKLRNFMALILLLQKLKRHSQLIHKDHRYLSSIRNVVSL